MTLENRDASQTTSHEPLSPTEMLEYYKERVGAFETEREQLLMKIDVLAVDQKELHRLEWENKQRVGEICELQKALSGANERLFTERSRLLKLQADNDDQKIREDEDRRKIQYLLSLTNPNGQEITYLRNTKPETIAHRAQVPQLDSTTSRKGCTLRTVYLPTANAESLIQKIDALQSQLNEQKQFSAERIEALLRDKRISEEQVTNHRHHLEQQLETATQKIERLEEMLRSCTRDYILARRGKQENEERAVAAETSLEKTKQELTSKFSQLKERATTELHRIQRTTQNAIDDYTDRFQDEVRTKQDDLRSLEKAFEEAKTQYDSRITELEGKVTKLSATNRQLETRRSHDIEGFVNEISQLRKKLDIIDRRLHQMRLVDRLSEDDRLDRMLQTIENKMPNLQTDDGDYYHKISTSDTDLVQEVDKIRSSLNGIEEKIRNRRHSTMTSL